MLLYREPFATDSDLLALRAHHRRDEAASIMALLAKAELPSPVVAAIHERAKRLVMGIRNAQQGTGVDALLSEFSLSTDEGIVLMCLAEALLRVPDEETCDALIRDKLLQGNWAAHLGGSDSLFVNASSWGLLLAGKVVINGDSGRDSSHQMSVLQRVLKRLGEPLVRAAMRYAMQVMGTQFVMGNTIEQALLRAQPQERKGYGYSYDMLGEGARTQQDADRYFGQYLHAIDALGAVAQGRGPIDSGGLSVKLSAIHPQYRLSQRARVVRELVPRLKQLALRAKRFDIGFTVDAEESGRLELSLEVIEAVFCDAQLQGWQGFGVAVQAYQKRALGVIDWALHLARRNDRKMALRLVKGAYWDSEIKRAQELGLEDYPVFTRKASTDVSYQACAKRLLKHRDCLYPQFASHNAYSVATVLEMDDGRYFPVGRGYEFQRLQGMGESLYEQLVPDDVACRIYAPVGEHRDLLAYLVRRLLENGANSSFVSNIVNDSVPLESLLEDPVAVVRACRPARNPNIVLPQDLFAGSDGAQFQRRNSRGLDLNDAAQLIALQSQLASSWSLRQRAQQRDTARVQETGVTLLNPANGLEVVGRVHYTRRAAVSAALESANDAFAAWCNTPVSTRAALLRTLADGIEVARSELMVLCIKEAGKTLVDAVAEIREAVDFCRYYADRAEQLMAAGDCQGRGVILCVSPWNFPVAIFVGQVAAALVTGNTVLAKPAEQTSLVAQLLVDLMKRSGFPEGVVQLLMGPGKPKAEQLLPDERLQGVLFTGSTAVGQWLARTLAKRPDDAIPLIAETGGLNSMIVDSTALPEQVVDDVIQSGFQSAGQRCSALRVLFLQEEVADTIIAMLTGAMDELQIGDPALLSCDLGPVINGSAHARLLEHVQRLQHKEPRARLLHCTPLPKSCVAGHFFAPHLFELDDLAVLTQEVFGPVVHVIRYRADKLGQVIEQINGSGFGLTLGVHSRIESMTRDVAEHANVGNVYINRNMIGAVVGVQPFGGRGLSGTGPKAGGFNYLNRLVRFDSLVDFDVTGAAVQSSRPDHGVQPHAWTDGDVTTRVVALEQWLSAAASALSVDFSTVHYQKLCGLCLPFIDQRSNLPGPTGERNRYITVARGLLVVAADKTDDFRVSLVQVLMSLLAGNRVCWVLGSRHHNRAAESVSLCSTSLPSCALTVFEKTSLNDFLTGPELQGVLVPPGSVLTQPIAQALSGREDALLPLIADEDPRAVMPRLQYEKTISTDTTAAGGNASLMTAVESNKGDEWSTALLK